MFLSTIQLMRALTLTTIKHLMQKNTAELKDGESRLNCRHFPL
jgi:hypothetical protein